MAAVATGFPSGQYSLATRLAEIKFAINEGAKEIDIVINRTLALQVPTFLKRLTKKNLLFKIISFQAPLARTVRRSESHESCVRSGNPHEINFGYWRIGQYGQCIQGLIGLHDGRIGFHQNLHRERICQCYSSSRACHVQVCSSSHRNFLIEFYFSLHFSEQYANITKGQDLW